MGGKEADSPREKHDAPPNPKDSGKNPWGNLNLGKQVSDLGATLSSPSVYIENIKLLNDADTFSFLMDRDGDNKVTKKEIDSYQTNDSRVAKTKDFLHDKFETIPKASKLEISGNDLRAAMADNLGKAIASSIRATGDQFSPELEKAFGAYANNIIYSSFRVEPKDEAGLAKKFEAKVNKLLQGTAYKCHANCETLAGIHGMTVKQLTVSVEKNGKQLPNKLSLTLDTDR